MDGQDLVLLLLGAVVLLAVGVLIYSFVGTPLRDKAGYVAGIVVAVALQFLLRTPSEGSRDWRPGLVAALAVAVAVDLLLQVPRVRPTPSHVAIAVAAWGVGAVLVAPLVVAVYVARRVMRLTVVPRARVSR